MKQNAEAARVSYELMQWVLQEEKLRLTNQAMTIDNSERLRRIELREAEVHAKMAQLSSATTQKWAQLTGNALHATANIAVKASGQALTLLKMMQTAGQVSWTPASVAVQALIGAAGSGYMPGIGLCTQSALAFISQTATIAGWLAPQVLPRKSTALINSVW